MSTYNKKFTERFSNKYQLVLRNVDSFSEKVSYPFHYFTLLMLIITWFGLNFGMGLWLAKGALGKWMNPVYLETENQKKIMDLVSTVDQFNQKLQLQDQYIATLQKLIADPDHHTPIPIAQTETSDKGENYNPTSIDQTINQQAQNESAILIPPPTKGLWMAPINGMITEKFNKSNAHYGIDIVAKDNTSIKAIANGIVILADWSVETGWIIAIQHDTNDVSIYKHCAILFKKIGHVVKTGDVIALMGNSGEISTGPHLHFELWKNGQAQNPEDFINFH